MRCAVYIRVSTDKEEQKASLNNQQDLATRYISENSWDLHEFYIDVKSGTTDKREQLQQLISDAKANKFDVILSKELSRLARNGRLSYEIRDIAERYGIHIVTLDNAINTLTGQVNMFGIYTALYEAEADRISERVKAARRSLAHRGLFKGSNPPYGYEVKNGKLFIRPDKTPDVVRYIFKQYLSGKGFDYIARQLYNNGLSTPAQIAGKKNANDKWQGSTIRCILTNPHYTGDLVQGRSTTKSARNKNREHNHPDNYIVVSNTHEAIISKTDFEVVQQLIQSRKRTRPQAEKHLFTNTLYCADCGSGMHYKKNSRGYICGNYNKHGSKACSNHLIREADLQLVISSELQMFASTLKDQDILLKIESKMQQQQQTSQKQIEVFSTEIKRLKQKKKKIFDLFVDDKIPKEDYDDSTIDINNEINATSSKIKQLESSLQVKENEPILKELKKQLDIFISFQKLTPEILHRLIDRIEIKADGNPNIFYRCSDPSAYSSILSINAQHST